MTDKRVARLDEIIGGKEADTTTARDAGLAKRVCEAEERLSRGVGRRVVHVMVGDSINLKIIGRDWAISDELAVLARDRLRKLAALHAERGNPHATVAALALSGLSELRDIVRTGALAGEHCDRRLELAGLALLRLYDECVLLRRHQPTDEEEIFPKENPLALSADPADEYWLVLTEFGDPPRFALNSTEPSFGSHSRDTIH